MEQFSKISIRALLNVADSDISLLIVESHLSSSCYNLNLGQKSSQPQVKAGLPF
jgi:hypothetical protein